MSNTDNPITLRDEVIDNGRRAIVTRITELPSNGVEMATLIYLDNDETGAAPVDELVRADEYAKLLPAPTFTTERIDRHGMNLTGDPVRRYKADNAQRAATIAAASYLGRDELMAAEIEKSDGGVFAFIPTTGAPVRLRVTLVAPVEDAPERTVVDEIVADADAKRQDIGALFGKPRTVCPRCAGTNGNHGQVHVRHGNGGGHNEPCPNTPAVTEPKFPAGTPEYDAYRAELGAELEKFAQAEAPYDVVGRDEQLHPSTHPYRVNEPVTFVGQTPTSDAWASGPITFQEIAADGQAAIMTTVGQVRVEVADLRRTLGNLAVELTPSDIARVFQALATEVDRLTALPQGDPASLAHAVELRNRFAALHP